MQQCAVTLPSSGPNTLFVQIDVCDVRSSLSLFTVAALAESALLFRFIWDDVLSPLSMKTFLTAEVTQIYPLHHKCV